MHRICSSLTLAVVLLAASLTRATVFTTDIDLSGYIAAGGYLNAGNTSTTVNLSPNAYVLSAQWIDLEFDAVGDSFQSDLVLSLNQSGSPFNFWDHQPALGTDAGGHFSGSGNFSIPGSVGGGPFQTLGDGSVYFETYDVFPDNNDVDEQISSGTLRITWSDSLNTPAATETTPGGSLSGTLASGEIKWHHFNWDGGDFHVDTLGTSLSPDNDTEIGLYNALGELIASNDDIDFVGANYLSELDLPGLNAGEYYLALGGFNSEFGDVGFAASSTSPLEGEFNINGLSEVPEPGSMTLIAAGICIFIRRRR